MSGIEEMTSRERWALAANTLLLPLLTVGQSLGRLSSTYIATSTDAVLVDSAGRTFFPMKLLRLQSARALAL